MKRLLWLLPVLVLAGCASPVPGRDVSRMLLVSTMGIDGQAGGITVSVSSPAQGVDTPGTAGDAEGESIQLAIRSLEHSGTRGEPCFAHVQYAVAGAAAAGDIGPLLDYFERSPQTRLDIPLYIRKDGEAAGLITGGTEEQEITALLGTLERESQRRGVPEPTVLSVARSLGRQGCALCSAVTGEEKDGAAVPRRAGYALLRESTPAVFLDGDIAVGIDLLTGRGAGLSLPLPEGVTVELRRVAAGLTPRKGGFSVTLRYSAALTECDREAPDTEAVNVFLSRCLAGCAEQALSAAQKEGADLFDLFSRWRRAFPDSSLTREELLGSMAWNIRTDGTVERSFDIDDTPEGQHGK